MLKHLVVSLFALVGDFSFLRFFAVSSAALALTALAYWLALPAKLPLWPGVVAVVIGALAGLAWELAARRNNET